MGKSKRVKGKSQGLMPSRCIYTHYTAVPLRAPQVTYTRAFSYSQARGHANLYASPCCCGCGVRSPQPQHRFGKGGRKGRGDAHRTGPARAGDRGNARDGCVCAYGCACRRLWLSRSCCAATLTTVLQPQPACRAGGGRVGREGVREGKEGGAATHLATPRISPHRKHQVCGAERNCVCRYT